MKTNKIIALAGQPNVGKSTVFNALTRLKQHTGNWAGKTVEPAMGTAKFSGKTFTVIDLPGCYSLNSQGGEEKIARDFICSGDAEVTIVICDATRLERGLIFALEVLEITKRVVVCANLMDEAKSHGIAINLPLLEEKLGVPVVGVTARNGHGIDSLMKAVNRANDVGEDDGAPSRPSPEEICAQVVSFSQAGGAHATQPDTTISSPTNPSGSEQQHAMNQNPPCKRDEKIDRILTGKLTATPVMLLALFGILWITIQGANYPSELLVALFTKIEGYLLALLPSHFLTDMMIMGVWRSLAWVVAVMLPPMALFFPLFALLEDAGILPRIAFNLDHFFKKCSACGKQALTMCMGLGCNAVGIVGSRIINSPRERLLAIITNNFIPCNGRFPILIAVIAMFFSGASGFLSGALLLLAILVSVLATFAVSKLLSKTLLCGEQSSFILELPPYRRPQIFRVIIRSFLDKTLRVLARAVMVAAPAGLIIWLMANTLIDGVSVLSICSSYLDPFAHFIGIDGVILLAFILGLPANEIVVPIMLMAYTAGRSLPDLGTLTQIRALLINNGWTTLTAINVCLLTLFHWPCATTCLTIKKETGSWKWTLVSIAVPTLLGFVSVSLLTFLVRMSGAV